MKTLSRGAYGTADWFLEVDNICLSHEGSVTADGLSICGLVVPRLREALGVAAPAPEVPGWVAAEARLEELARQGVIGGHVYCAPGMGAWTLMWLPRSERGTQHLYEVRYTNGHDAQLCPATDRTAAAQAAVEYAESLVKPVPLPEPEVMTQEERERELEGLGWRFVEAGGVTTLEYWSNGGGAIARQGETREACTIRALRVARENAGE